jgi:hypothetical protein
MSVADWISIGVIMAGTIYFFMQYKRKEEARIIPLEKDAAKRAEWAAKQKLAEAEMEAKINEFKAKKARYQQLKKELEADDKQRDNKTTSSPSSNNSSADVFILNRRNKDDDNR